MSSFLVILPTLGNPSGYRWYEHYQEVIVLANNHASSTFLDWLGLVLADATAFSIAQFVLLVLGVGLAICGAVAFIHSVTIDRQRSAMRKVTEFILVGMIVGISGSLTNIAQNELGNTLGPLAGLLIGGIVGGFFAAGAGILTQMLSEPKHSQFRGVSLITFFIGVFTLVVRILLPLLVPTLP